MNLNILSQNRGFTLIELLVTFVISLLIILGVSFSFKTIVLGWNKTEKIYNDLQKYIYITNLIKKNLSKVYTKKKYFFKGEENNLIFFTNSSGLHMPGLFEIGYFFDKNNLNICYIQIKKEEDIVEPIVLKSSENCIEFNNIKNINFLYGKFNEYKEIEYSKVAFKKPDFIKLNLLTNYLDEELIFDLEK